MELMDCYIWWLKNTWIWTLLKLIICHTFVWVGLVKQLSHRYLLVYLKYIPRKYKVQHRGQLQTGIGRLLLEVGELVQLAYVCIYIEICIYKYIYSLLDTSLKEAVLATFISQCHSPEYSQAIVTFSLPDFNSFTCCWNTDVISNNEYA